MAKTPHPAIRSISSTDHRTTRIHATLAEDFAAELGDLTGRYINQLDLSEMIRVLTQEADDVQALINERRERDLEA